MKRHHPYLISAFIKLIKETNAWMCSPEGMMRQGVLIKRSKEEKEQRQKMRIC